VTDTQTASHIAIAIAAITQYALSSKNKTLEVLLTGCCFLDLSVHQLPWETQQHHPPALSESKQQTNSLA